MQTALHNALHMRQITFIDNNHKYKFKVQLFKFEDWKLTKGISGFTEPRTKMEKGSEIFFARIRLFFFVEPLKTLKTVKNRYNC